MIRQQELDRYVPATIQVEEEWAIIQARRNGVLVGIGSMIVVGLVVTLLCSLVLTCSTIYLWRLETQLLQAAQRTEVARHTVHQVAVTPIPPPTPTSRRQQSHFSLRVLHFRQQMEAEQQQITLALEIRHTNQTSAPQPYQISDFYLKDQSGTVYFPLNRETDLTNGVLVPNGVVQGQLSFALPSDQHVQTLIWQTDDPAQTHLIPLE